jgi:hypothetical protein
MGKRKLIFIIIPVVIIVAIGSFAYFNFYKKRLVSPIGSIQPTPSASEELTTWVDQAEFSFQYPKSLKLDPHEEDQENYAHVELNSATHSGSLIIWVKDTTAEDTETWAKETKLVGAIDSTLGGLPAKKTLNNEQKQLAVTTIRNGYLYQIEANLADATYWNQVYETVSSNFKFVEGETKTDDSSADTSSYDNSSVGSEEVYGDEEVIE